VAYANKFGVNLPRDVEETWCDAGVEYYFDDEMAEGPAEVLEEPRLVELTRREIDLTDVE
jgi:hypothetical protein